MSAEIRSRFVPVLALLAALMLATRLPDAAQLLHLRDASMAVFFLGGLLLRRHLAFFGLMALAVGIDVLVFARTDMVHVCLSPAYGFLLPSYGVLWFAGRALAPMFDGSAQALVLACVLGLAGALASFAISNGSFYVLSGLFGELSLGGFSEQFLRYAPAFVLTGGAWICLGLTAVALLIRQGWLQASPAKVMRAA